MSPPERIRAAGLRRTPARIAVFGRLLANGRPYTHAELLADPELAGLDHVTLYRTLAALVDAELIHRVFGIDGVWRYGVQPAGGPGCPGNHVHFLCRSCGGMRCLYDSPMPRVPLPESTEVEGRHFLVYGRCAACVRAGEATA